MNRKPPLPPKPRQGNPALQGGEEVNSLYQRAFNMAVRDAGHSHMASEIVACTCGPPRLAVGLVPPRPALPEARTVYLVGDTVADMKAAVANGAHGVGVCTGAETGPSLAEAGAATVLADVRDLPGLLGLTRPGEGRWLPAHVPGMTSAADLWFDNR